MKKFITTNCIIGVLLILVGLYIQFDINICNIFDKTKENLNLNLLEVDTYYDNNSSIEYTSYVDTSWGWPTDSNYYISNPYQSYNHAAIDIVPNESFNIYSAYDGEVITNSYRNDNGNYLVIKQDNGYYILYAHLSEKLVNVGEQVKKGQLIGIMGMTGHATGIHLHFSVWEGYPHSSTPVNPLNFY